MALVTDAAGDHVLQLLTVDHQVDVILDLGPPRRTYLRVSSKAMCLASPVFAEKLKPVLTALQNYSLISISLRHTPKCDAQILGSIIKGFFKQGFFPIPDDGAYSGLTVIGVAEALKNLELFCDEGHQINYLEETRTYLNRAIADIYAILKTTEGPEVRMHMRTTYPISGIADMEDINTGGQPEGVTTVHDFQLTSTGLGVAFEKTTSAVTNTREQAKGKHAAVVSANHLQPQVRGKGYLRCAADAERMVILPVEDIVAGGEMLLVRLSEVENRMMADTLYRAGWDFIQAKEKLRADGFLEKI
ncbi:hypothetical protein RUND412_006699 [Rhizina undulata]